MSTCDPTKPNCLKNSPSSRAKFCTSCGLPAAAARAALPAAPTAPPRAPLNTAAIKSGLLADLSARRTVREVPSVAAALMAAAGVLLGLGVIVIAISVFDGDFDTNTAGAVLVSIAALGALWFLGTRFPTYLTGVTAAVQIITPVTVLLLFLNGAAEDGELGLPMLLVGASLLGFWALPGLRARPSLLGAGVLWATTGLGVLMVQSNVRSYINDFDFLDDPEAFFGDIASEAGVIVMVIGIGLLLAGWNFDRKGWPNLATPFIAVGVYSAILGTFGYISNGVESSGAAILILSILSLGLIAVGGAGERRATTWIGTFLLISGLIGLVINMTGDNASESEVAVFLLVIGGLVGFIGNRFGAQITAKIKNR